MTEILSFLGKRISELRKKLGFSQQELADRTGFKRTTVSSIERDDQKPTLEFLLKFSQITGLSIDEILQVNSVKGKSLPEKLDSLPSETDVSKVYEIVHEVKDYLHQLETENKELQAKYVNVLEDLKSLQEKLATIFDLRQ